MVVRRIAVVIKADGFKNFKKSETFNLSVNYVNWPRVNYTNNNRYQNNKDNRK